MSPEARPYRILALGVLLALLACFYAPLPAPLPPDQLDTSWQIVIGHDLLEGRAFGVDTVFQAGVLGYFMSPVPPFIPGLYWVTIGVSVLLALGALWILLSAAREQPWAVRALLVVALVVLAPCHREFLHLAALAAMPTAIAVARRVGFLALAAGALYLAAAALVKNTLFAAAALSLFASIVVLAKRRGILVAMLAPVLAAAAFALVWLAARQPLENVPAYLATAWESIVSYPESMAMAEPPMWLGLTLAPVIALGIACLAGLVSRVRQDDVAGVVSVGTISAVVALAAKLGVVRADAHHRLATNGVLILLALLLPSSASRTADVFRGIAVACAAFGFFLATPSIAYEAERVVPVLSDRGYRIGGLVTGAHVELVERLMVGVEAPCQLPVLRERIGSRPVDLLGTSQGVLYANRLSVRHRPVFQDYAAQSPWLEEKNAAFFESAQAPPCVLARLHPIDGRLPMISDSATIRALLTRYRPVAVENVYALFERDPAAVSHERVEERTIDGRFGEAIDLSALGDGLFEASIDARPTLAGGAIAALHRPSLLFLVVKLADGGEQRFRISRSLAKSPFVLSPHVDSTQALVNLFWHRVVRRVTSVRLEAEEGREWAFEPGFRLKLWKNESLWRRLRDLPNPPSVSSLLSCPTFGTQPDDATPASSFAPLDEGGRGLMALPPSSLSWNLGPGAFVLRGRYGMLRPSFEPGASDGVTFSALVEKDGGPTELFKRHLNPKAAPADREVISFELPFQLSSAGKLVLKTEPGPAGNGDFDWSFWSGVTIEKK